MLPLLRNDTRSISLCFLCRRISIAPFADARDAMTVDTQFSKILAVKGLRRVFTRREIGKLHNPSAVTIDLSSLVRSLAYTPNEFLTWTGLCKKICRSLQWVKNAQPDFVFLISDQRFTSEDCSGYPALRVAGTLQSRNTYRVKNEYISLDPFRNDDDAVFELDRLLDTPGGHDLVIKMLPLKLEFDAILITKRNLPPTRIYHSRLPSYMSDDTPVCALWKDTPRVNMSECDNLAMFLLFEHKRHYPHLARILVSKDGDLVVSAALHNDTDLMILWPDGQNFQSFNMAGICELFGGSPFSVSRAMVAAFFLYMAGNDFAPPDCKLYSGITPSALVTLAFQPDLPLFIQYTRGRVVVDTDILDEFLLVQRTKSITYLDKLPSNAPKGFVSEFDELAAASGKKYLAQEEQRKRFCSGTASAYDMPVPPPSSSGSPGFTQKVMELTDIVFEEEVGTHPARRDSFPERTHHTSSQKQPYHQGHGNSRGRGRGNFRGGNGGGSRGRGRDSKQWHSSADARRPSGSRAKEVETVTDADGNVYKLCHSRPKGQYASSEDQLKNIIVMNQALAFVFYLLFIEEYEIPVRTNLFSKVGLC
jgi:uncharacterized membrane protein YgcG